LLGVKHFDKLEFEVIQVLLQLLLLKRQVLLCGLYKGEETCGLVIELVVKHLVDILHTPHQRCMVLVYLTMIDFIGFQFIFDLLISCLLEGPVSRSKVEFLLALLLEDIYASVNLLESIYGRIHFLLDSIL
jgi:hypothetical protein